MSTKQMIQTFLDDVKHAHTIHIIPTEKNRKTRLLLGLTTYDQEYLIRHLDLKDYVRGPLDDYAITKPGKVWIFKHKYQGNVLYVKLKDKMIQNGQTIVICLSCHIDNLQSTIR